MSVLISWLWGFPGPIVCIPSIFLLIGLIYISILSENYGAAVRKLRQNPWPFIGILLFITVLLYAVTGYLLWTTG